MIIVDKFVSFEEADSLPQAPIGGLGGFFNFETSGQRWKDYLNIYEEQAFPYLEALRSKILSDNIRNGGFWHQEEGCPVFSDEKAASFSMRAWGDFLAAVWSEQENKDYSYIDFAWEH